MTTKGSCSGLRSLGLLNEIAPDIGELSAEPEREELVALCFSPARTCAGPKQSAKPVQILEAQRNADYCPRCGAALVWTSPGLKGKRRLRRKYD